MPSESIQQNIEDVMCSHRFKDSIGYWTNMGSISDNCRHQAVASCTMNDIITIILDFKENKASFLKNDNEQIEIPILPNIPYVIGVSVILDYSIQYIQ